MKCLRLTILWSKMLIPRSYLFFSMVLAATLAVRAGGEDAVGPCDILKCRFDQSKFYGLSITYQVAYGKCEERWVFEEDRDSVDDGIRTLDIGYPSEDSISVPFRLTHAVENEGEPGVVGPMVVSYWEAFDGLTSRRFTRTLFADACGGAMEHVGVIEAGGAVQLLHYDPLVNALFRSSATLGRLVGHDAGDFSCPEGLRANAETKVPFGTVYRVVFDAPAEVDGWTLFTPPPNCFVIDTSSSNKIAIDELKTFGSVVLPGSGVFKSDRWEGSFRVLGVEKFDPANEELFPEWASGTTVLDRIEGTATRNPMTVNEVSLVEKIFRKNCLGVTTPVESHGVSWWVWGNVALGGCLLIWYLSQRMRAN